MADELYALAPERFTAERDARVKQARAAGDRALAERIGGLRRPTRTAWLVNRLGREHRRTLGELLALGPALRTAQASLAGAEVQRLSAERQRLISALQRAASRLAAEDGQQLTASTGQELTATLEAALADPGAADAVRSGRLASALSYSGFGWGDVPPGDAPPVHRARSRPPAARAAAESAEALRWAAQQRHAVAQERVTDLDRQLQEAKRDASVAADQLKAATRAVRGAKRL